MRTRASDDGFGEEEADDHGDAKDAQHVASARLVHHASHVQPSDDEARRDPNDGRIGPPIRRDGSPQRDVPNPEPQADNLDQRRDDRRSDDDPEDQTSDLT